MVNINTKEYWDSRFGSKDWESKGGYSQTRYFAEGQIPHLGISSDFTGVICDFGCGAGDAFPVYRREYPNATLVGVDFSTEAIKLCHKRYGDFAKFYCGTSSDTPVADIIICSNVLEHVDDDIDIVNQLLKCCKKLYVIVPYKERPLSSEHIREYDENSFFDLNPTKKAIYLCKGWSKYGFDLWVGIYLKNIARVLLRRHFQSQRRQIAYEFVGHKEITS